MSNAGTPGVPAVTLDYSYDSFGNRTSLTDSLGGSISYGYNAGNEMTSLGLSLSSTTLDAQVTLAYDGAGNVTGMTQTAPSASNPHTIATSYSYNHSNELTNITYMDTTANVTLANYTYGYNTAGVLTSYQDNSGNSLSYGYDANDELTSATGTLAGANYTFTYDYGRNGNRTSTSTDVNGTLTSATYTTGSGNELQSDGTNSYTYDNNGNMLTQTNIATGSVTSYTWDYDNRLTEVRTGTSDEKFTYDVFGNRIGVSLNGTQQLYTVYDGDNPYMDFNGNGTLTERYLTNPNGLSHFYGQVNGSGTTEWFLTDYLGSVRQVVDTSGNVLDAITYDPYGNIVIQTSATYAPRFLYAGGAYDPITGTYLDRAREDDPADGRWLSQDPTGLGPDSNPYRYADNSPSLFIDPSGTQKLVPEPEPQQSVTEEKECGAFANKADNTRVAPISIKLSEKGSPPHIRRNNRKSNQYEGPPNDNPWLGRGGPNAKVGDIFWDGFLNLEWMIKFDGNPYNCTWGRNIVTWCPWYLKEGKVAIRYFSDINPVRDDTDHQNEYVVGNNVYMYDQPGRALDIPLIAPARQFLFEVWAKSSDGKTMLSEWFYVDPARGSMYAIDRPTLTNLGLAPIGGHMMGN